MTDRRRRRASPADTSPGSAGEAPAGSAGEGTGHEDNPFAPPPEGQPDRPWQPRHPEGNQDASGDDEQGRGNGDGGDRDDEDGTPSRWGGKWSPRQPGRHSGGFGSPGGQSQGDGPGGNGGRQGGGLRWDPTDRRQRHARYALHAGIWGLFFALFSMIEIALLLGTLAVYWGASALREKQPAEDRTDGGGWRSGLFGSRSGSRSGSETDARASAQDVAGTDRKSTGEQSGRTVAGMQVTVSAEQAAKARKTAAVSGLVAGGLTLAVVAGTFTLQMVYDEYFTCRQDALTQASREHCTGLLPEEIRPFLQNQG